MKWPFRGGFPLGSYLSISGNELRWTPSTSGTFQNFTCVAENQAAGRSAEATKVVKVTGTDHMHVLNLLSEMISVPEADRLDFLSFISIL